MSTASHYYTADDKAATMIGSGILLAGVTKTALRNVGPFWDLSRSRKLTTFDLEADTGAFDEDIVDEENHEFGFKILAGHFDIIAMIAGGLDKIVYTLEETATTVTDEKVTLGGTSWTRLKNRMGDRTICTITSVEEDTQTDPDTYILDTDFEKEVDPAGYTRIRRKGAGITDGQTVLVTYSYKACKHIKLSSGGMDTIQPRFYKFLHVDKYDEATGKIWGYSYDFFKGIVKDFGDEAVPKYNDKKVPYRQAFQIKCNPDLTKPKGEQVMDRDLILGETLTDLGIDYLDKDELGVQIRAMLVAQAAA